MTRLSPLHFLGSRRLLALLALLGTGLVLLATSRYGAGLASDSVGYIATARNLMAGSGLLLYDGTPLLAQPPLFPALLALAGGLIKTDPLLLVSAVNALLFGLIVYFGGILAFRCLSGYPIFAFIGTLAILVSVPLFTVSIIAWSEPLFILFVVLSLLFADSYLEKNDKVSLTLLSISVALSFLTRYIGAVLVIWAAVIVMATFRGSFKIRMAHLVVFAMAPAVSIGTWLVRNYLVSGTPLGPRASSVHTLSRIPARMKNLVSWYVPSIVPGLGPILMALGAALLLLRRYAQGNIGKRRNFSASAATNGSHDLSCHCLHPGSDDIVHNYQLRCNRQSTFVSHLRSSNFAVAHPRPNFGRSIWQVDLSQERERLRDYWPGHLADIPSSSNSAEHSEAAGKRKWLWRNFLER